MTQHILVAVFVLYSGGVLWLAVNLFSTLAMLRAKQSLPAAPRNGRSWPSLDILVPVKDEAGTIGQCLASVVSQDYPQPRVLVVNDRSTDDTGEAVRAFARDHALVQAFDVRELPAGHFGKPHALHTLSSELRGEALAFVDSDLHLEPHCLRTLIHYLIANDLDWVATMGRPEISKFWESLLVPLLGAISFAWYDPRKISDPKWPNAIGSALMVCRRTAYDAIGGHGCVIRTYDEDSELIRIAKRAGQRVSFVLVPGLFTQRHYGTLAATVRGVTRTLVGGVKTIPRLLLTIQALVFVSLLPIAVVAAGGVARSWSSSAWATGVLVVGLLHLVVSTALAHVVYRTAGPVRRYAWLHPLGSAVMIGICLRALAHLGRGARITWRGTTY